MTSLAIRCDWCGVESGSYGVQPGVDIQTAADRTRRLVRRYRWRSRKGVDYCARCALRHRLFRAIRN